jgi:hypothetical protein
MAKKYLESMVGTTVNGVYIKKYFYISSEIKKDRRSYFDCICPCGKEFTTRAIGEKYLTKSCGCQTGRLVSSKTAKENSILNRIKASYKQSAIRHNREFLLSDEDFAILLSKDCFYCGSKPIERSYDKNRNNRIIKFFSWNGIDRVDNSIGYNKENCVTCCINCNRAKHEMSQESFIIWLNQVAKFRNLI